MDGLEHTSTVTIIIIIKYNAGKDVCMYEYTNGSNRTG